MLKVAVAGRKGGVGKTSLAVSIADDLANRHGIKVLVIDMDPQANATAWLGVDLDPHEGDVSTMADALYHSSTRGILDDAIIPTGWEGVWCAPAEPELASREADAVPSSELRLRRCMRTANLDGWCGAVIIDTPPSLGPLLHNALNAVDQVVIVTDSERGGVDGVAGLIDAAYVVAEDSHPTLQVAGIAMNKANGSVGEHAARWDELRGTYPDLPRWKIPQRAAVATAYGASIPPRAVPRNAASSFVLGVRDVVDHLVGQAS